MQEQKPPADSAVAFLKVFEPLLFLFLSAGLRIFVLFLGAAMRHASGGGLWAGVILVTIFLVNDLFAARWMARLWREKKLWAYALSALMPLPFLLFDLKYLAGLFSH